MNIIDIVQDLGLPASFLIITIYAIKMLYKDLSDDKKRHEVMLTER